MGLGIREAAVGTLEPAATGHQVLEALKCSPAEEETSTEPALDSITQGPQQGFVLAEKTCQADVSQKASNLYLTSPMDLGSHSEVSNMLVNGLISAKAVSFASTNFV